MSRKECDFFPLFDVLQEGFRFVGNAVGVDRKADEHEVVFIKLCAVLDLFELFVTLQDFVNGFCDFFCISCDAEIGDKSFQCRSFLAKI